MASRVEQKRRLKAEREAKAAAAAARERRARRLRTLIAAFGTAAVVVVAAIVISTGSAASGEEAKGPAEGAAETARLFAGIPQDGLNVGDPDAPVTLVEFADLQCPYCRDAALASLPVLVDEYVRQGKLRIELRNFAILGEDSERAARALAAAADQDKAWQFLDLFYRNQGEEHSGYVTDDFIRRIAQGVDGLEVEPVVQAANAPAEPESLNTARIDAQRFGVQSTPSFLIGRTGHTPRPLALRAPNDLGTFRQAIDATLATR
jgi:protein-disulfide isomerase